MGRIIGGLGSPHAPSIGALIDQGGWDQPEWKKLMDGYRPMQDWLAAHKPDAAILIYNDHVTSFFSTVTRPLLCRSPANIRLPTRALAQDRCRRCAASPISPGIWRARWSRMNSI